MGCGGGIDVSQHRARIAAAMSRRAVLAMSSGNGSSHCCPPIRFAGWSATLHSRLCGQIATLHLLLPVSTVSCRVDGLVLDRELDIRMALFAGWHIPRLRPLVGERP